MTILKADGISAGYHNHPVVHDFTLSVEPGQMTAILGPNGAGKTTTLLTLAGVLKPLAGSVEMYGKAAPKSLHARAREGLAFISETRSVFMELTTLENLKVGQCDVARALDIFPELEPLLPKPAGLLSGGEQQMLTLVRALTRGPKILLIDELSLGLAPKVVERLLDEVRRAADEAGIAVVLVEQHINQALSRVDDAIVLRRGRVSLSGRAEELRNQTSKIQDAYLSH
ncbi:ATP-binding cassette domain-containing protein [Microbispora sp. NBRC 16548]|uniref:ABC transporter ATP-binding protein n=1 Tax=Microbispora sp. NBRC 16548 TaxID=3030994 RepID=UPI0024A2902D|nr:ATP-binding cassette domain-containing protein [Microbispora sp. NBRC 16548]GLX11160.1 ABC transporter ATP-binding protein [Microbispora sp. NBRC 16548]